jgi:DNA-binding transcriptional LysR family regulator
MLRISQPAVSMILQQTQDQFKLRLFTREHGRLVPTQEAPLLGPELVKAMAAVNGVLRRMDDMQGELGGLLTVPATPTLANTLLPEAMAKFLGNHSKAEVKIGTELNQGVINNVVDHRADLGLILRPANDMATSGRDLAATDLVCVMPRDHPLSNLAEITPQDLSGTPLISYDGRQPIGSLIDVAFEQAGRRRVVAAEIMQPWTGCALIAAGAGVAIVDGYALLGRAFTDLPVRPSRPRVRIIVRLLQAQHRPLSPLAKSFALDLRGIIDVHIAAGTLEEA